MSLVTDTKILSLWKDAHAAVGIDGPAKIFWMQLLSKYIFAGTDYMVDRGDQTSSADPTSRVDIVVNYIGKNTEAHVLCFVRP